MADITVTAASVLASSTAVLNRQYNFAATVTAGQTVYLNSSNKWALFDQDSATGAAITDKRGCALNGGALDQPAVVVEEDTGFTSGGTMTVGTAVYGSSNAGAITHDVPGSGKYPVLLGMPKSTTVMVLKPVAGGVAV